MAFGSGKDGDPGDWSYKPPKDEPDEPTPTKQPPTPPARTAQPAAPPTKEQVTPESIAQAAAEIFPTDRAAAEFAVWRAASLPDLVHAVTRSSGIELALFESRMEQWGKDMGKLVADLNEKEVAAVDPAEPCPELPGECNDPTCRSLFDVNDLAIRGRKALSSKRFYFPMIFPEFRIDSAQRWGVGQKVEYDQEWRHEGFTLGSLISSLSILPNEELTIEVSSWQRTKSEVQQENDDATRQVLEQELKRTDEQTILNEAASQNGWSVSATASVSYGPVSGSTSAGATGNASERISAAQRHVQEATSHATSEVSARRAIKITQTTESQLEQKTVRRMKNPNQCHTVTFNFFQVIKLIDVQMRFVNDAPVFYFPGLFPASYTNGLPVRIPYEAVESFTAPGLFLTQFFDIDRDLSQEIHGFALRVRMDVARAPAAGLRALTEALLVATKFLLKLDPAQHVSDIARFLSSYAESAVALRASAVAEYGPKKGKSHQLNTPGVYADSLLGRCGACEDEIASERYVAIQRQEAERRQIESTNQLLDAEAERRKRRLADGLLDPFEAPNPSP